MAQRQKIILYTILGIILVILLVSAGKIIYFEMFKLCGDCGKPVAEKPVATNERLNDPDLLYASKTSSGLCSNGVGEEGGCYTEYYLYNSGQFVKILGWVGMNEKKSESADEKYLNVALVDQVKQQFKDLGIMSQDCPVTIVTDIAWNYQINLEGVKKSWRNPPGNCKTIFDSIDKILNSAMDNNK